MTHYKNIAPMTLKAQVSNKTLNLNTMLLAKKYKHVRQNILNILA